MVEISLRNTGSRVSIGGNGLSVVDTPNGTNCTADDGYLSQRFNGPALDGYRPPKISPAAVEAAAPAPAQAPGPTSAPSSCAQK